MAMRLFQTIQIHGVVALACISKMLNYKIRNDMSFTTNDYEATFVEVQATYKNLKNTMVGVVYRHPHDNHES